MTGARNSGAVVGDDRDSTGPSERTVIVEQAVVGSEQLRPSSMNQNGGDRAKLRTLTDTVVWREGSSLLIRGSVESGDQRGRQLGFPTANIVVEHLDVDEGVWAGWLTGDDAVRRSAAVSVGRRETIYGRAGTLIVEAFVLDFSGDLYGQVVTVELLRFIRRQRRFRTLTALTDQLAIDVETCRIWAEGQGENSEAS